MNNQNEKVRQLKEEIDKRKEFYNKMNPITEKENMIEQSGIIYGLEIALEYFVK